MCRKCQECADELQRLVEIYDRMDQVSSGNEVKDSGLIEMRDIVTDDLRSLISDLKENQFSHPDTPIGFRGYAVIH